MDKLTKSSSGLLYEEKFGEDISLIWDFVPNNLDRVRINLDSIEVLPGVDRVEMLMPCPSNEEWVCQTNISYAGRTSTESAGFILKSITDNVAECELKGDTRDLFDYMKMEMNRDSVFSLKASNDGVYWKDFGNSKIFDANMMGFFVNELTQHDPLMLKTIIVCKSNFITMRDLPKDSKVTVLDIDDISITHRFIIKKENNTVILDGSNILFPIPYLKVKLSDESGSEIRTVELYDVYGGDVFDFNYNVTFTIEGQMLGDKSYALDAVSGPYSVYSLQVSNNEPYDITNKILKIEAYSTFNNGHVPVSMAETTSIDNFYDLSFKKEIALEFKPYENKNFYIKIEKLHNTPIVDSEYRFKISLV